MNPTYSGPRGTYVITEELKKSIGYIAVDEGKNTSEVVRDLLKEALTARGVALA